MANPAEESAYSLSEETWHRIQARRRKADWRRQRAIARLVKPDADKLAVINTRCVLERLAAYAIPALGEIYQPSHLASFLQSLDAERRFLLDEITPIMSEHIRSVFGSGPAADSAFRCKLLVDADFNGWESEGHRKAAELLRHSQVQIAGIMRLGISRLTLDTESEKCECHVIKGINSGNVPDSAREGKTYPTEIGRFLDQLRIERGWSVEGLAKRAELHKSTVTRHINKVSGIHDETLVTYAELFSEKKGRKITFEELKRLCQVTTKKLENATKKIRKTTEKLPKSDH